MYVLVDQYDPDIFPLVNELFKSLLDGGDFGFGVDDEEVL